MLICKRKFASSAAMVAALLLLQACGGDDAAPAPGSGNSGGTPAPTGSSPTPTPSAIYPPAPFGLTATQDLSVVGMASVDAEGKLATPASATGRALLTPDMVSLRWDAQKGTYELALSTGESGIMFYREAPNSGNIFRVGPSPQQPGHLTVYLTYPVRPTGTTNYLGYLSVHTQNETYSYLNGLVGIGTTEAEMPKTGIARYTTRINDKYSPQIRLDFTLGRLSGSMPIAWQDAWGPYEPTTYALTDLDISPGQTSFTATFDVPDAPTHGIIRGRFMGAQANMLALAYISPILGPDGWTTYAGTIETHLCTTCTN